MSVDLNRIGEARQQLQLLGIQMQVQQQQLVTQQSALSLDAAKFMITLERGDECISNFTEDEIKMAYETVARIARMFAPVPSPEPGDAIAAA